MRVIKSAVSRCMQCEQNGGRESDQLLKKKSPPKLEKKAQNWMPRDTIRSAKPVSSDPNHVFFIQIERKVVILLLHAHIYIYSIQYISTFYLSNRFNLFHLEIYQISTQIPVHSLNTHNSCNLTCPKLNDYPQISKRFWQQHAISCQIVKK